MAPMTQADIIAKLLGTIGIESNLTDDVVKNSIKRLTALQSMSKVDLIASLTNDSRLMLSNTTEIVALQAWYIKDWLGNATNKGGSVPVQNFLTPAIWEDFLSNEYNGTLDYTLKAGPTPTPPTPTPATNIPNNTNRFKVEVKDLPKLPKTTSVQDAFENWMEGYSVKLELAGLGDLIDETFVPPNIGDADYDEINK